MGENKENCVGFWRNVTAKEIYKPSLGTQVGTLQGLPAHFSFTSSQIYPSTHKSAQAVGGLTVAQAPSSGVTKHMEHFTKW